jgi:diguanylate cyclase (GGDEF)-like protein
MPVLLSKLWTPPPNIPGILETEWRLVPVRWIGILLMLPTLQLINLPAGRLVAAYGLLAVAACFNLFVQTSLHRRPDLLTNGYLTTSCDGLLNVGMISLAGGFDSPIYFVMYTVTVSAAMRYGYRPTVAVTAFFISCDLIESQLTGRAIGGPFLVRSGFLTLTGLLGSHLREQAWRAQAALKDQLARAEHEALHDRLTGLPNRGFLLNRLEDAISSAELTSSLALLMVDLDRFKELNDTLGHHYGDMLLCQVGERFLQALPPPTIVARLGGDEFAVLLPNANLQQATEVALRLQSALGPLFTVEEYHLDVGASIGIALFPEHGTDATSLLRHADVAMYVAKRSAEPFAVYSHDLDQHSLQRLALVGELREAIDRGEFTLHFQPKLDLADGSLVGAEALVRWQRPNGILVQPDLFIPVAEQNGLIRPLTRWVLDHALRQTAVWRRGGLTIPIAVNLSMRDLHDQELPEVVAEMLARWNVSPDQLLLEITESSLMVDPARALQTAIELSTIGVRLAIDDFGTGYSSLAYLKRLPVDELKIDKSFVGNMASDEEDATIVRSMVRLAHDLGLTVVAEGVEDDASWDALRQLGCDVAQGYYISRPLQAHDLASWVRAGLAQSPALIPSA